MFEVQQGWPQSRNLPCNNEGKSINIIHQGITTVWGQTNQSQTGKWASNPPCPAPMKGCPVGTTTFSPLCLNATSLSPNSFILSLTSALTCGPLQALLDSGSSHSFVDEVFAQHNKLTLAYLTEPILLWLFDGSSSSSVVSKTWMSITMPTGETHEVKFFVTKLDKGYSVVLWLQLAGTA